MQRTEVGEEREREKYGMGDKESAKETKWDRRQFASRPIRCVCQTHTYSYALACMCLL